MDTCDWDLAEQKDWREVFLIVTGVASIISAAGFHNDFGATDRCEAVHATAHHWWHCVTDRVADAAVQVVEGWGNLGISYSLVLFVGGLFRSRRFRMLGITLWFAGRWWGNDPAKGQWGHRYLSLCCFYRHLTYSRVPCCMWVTNLMFSIFSHIIIWLYILYMYIILTFI